jgi:hypothetical protein
MQSNLNYRTVSEPVLSGCEKYSVIGNKLSLDMQQRIQSAFCELTVKWDCLPKAGIVASHIPEVKVVVGSLMVDSMEEGVEYGHAWNPPYEFHAWCVFPDREIIDMALPGTIESGLATRDRIGYYLVGREPCILAGKPPEWLHYTIHEYVE